MHSNSTYRNLTVAFMGLTGASIPGTYYTTLTTADPVAGLATLGVTTACMLATVHCAQEDRRQLKAACAHNNSVAVASRPDKP